MVGFPFRRRMVSAWLLGCAALACSAHAYPAEPTFSPAVTFCNRTLKPLNLALSYDLAGSHQSTVEGWRKIRACACTTVIQNRPLRATEIFLFADRGAGQPNLLKPAQAQVCVKDKGFNFAVSPNGPQACTAAGGHLVSFKWYDTKGRDMTVNYRIAGQCNLMGDTH